MHGLGYGSEKFFVPFEEFTKLTKVNLKDGVDLSIYQAFQKHHPVTLKEYSLDKENEFQEELELLILLPHYFGWTKNDTSLWIIFEPLSTNLDSVKDLDPLSKLYITKEIATGIDFFHAKGKSLIGYLSPSNIFLDQYNLPKLFINPAVARDMESKLHMASDKVEVISFGYLLYQLWFEMPPFPMWTHQTFQKILLEKVQVPDMNASVWEDLYGVKKYIKACINTHPDPSLLLYIADIQASHPKMLKDLPKDLSGYNVVFTSIFSSHEMIFGFLKYLRKTFKKEQYDFVRDINKLSVEVTDESLSAFMGIVELYILSGSYFELNISGPQRQAIAEIYDQVKKSNEWKESRNFHEVLYTARCETVDDLQNSFSDWRSLPSFWDTIVSASYNEDVITKSSLCYVLDKLRLSFYNERFKEDIDAMKHFAVYLAYPDHLKMKYLTYDWDETERLTKKIRQSIRGDLHQDLFEEIELKLASEALKEKPKSIKVRIVILEKSTAKSIFGLKQFFSPLMFMMNENTEFLQREELVYTGLQIGPWMLQFDETSLCVPKLFFSDTDISLCVDLCEIPFDQLDDKLSIISNVIVQWNTKVKFMPDKKLKRDNRGNSQDFIESILTAIGCEIKYPPHMGQFLDQIRVDGFGKFIFKYDTKFQDKFKLNKTEIVFTTHKELDEMYEEFLRFEPRFAEVYPEEDLLLRSYDRTFWNKYFHLLSKLEAAKALVKKNIPLENEIKIKIEGACPCKRNGKDMCPMTDPTRTGSIIMSKALSREVSMLKIPTKFGGVTVVPSQKGPRTLLGEINALRKDGLFSKLKIGKKKSDDPLKPLTHVKIKMPKKPKMMSCERWLGDDYRNMENIIVLLGTKDCGKTTFWKHLICNADPTMAKMEIKGKKSIVYGNILRVSIEAGKSALKRFGKFETENTQACFDVIKKYWLGEFREGTGYTKEIYSALVKFWSDQHVKDAYHQFKFIDFWMYDGTDHFVQHIIKYKPELEYIPTMDDYLHLGLGTIGIHQLEVVTLNKKKYIYVDPGGSRVARKHWQEFQDKSKVFVWMASLCFYRDKCSEDGVTNRLIEDLNAFDKFVNDEPNKKKPVILIFSKGDVFVDFVKTFDINDVLKNCDDYPFYTGEKGKALDVAKHIELLYRMKIQNELERHVTIKMHNFLNTKIIQSLVAVIEEQVETSI